MYYLNILNDSPVRFYVHDALAQITSKLIQVDLGNASQSQNHPLTEAFFMHLDSSRPNEQI